jgi:hypothetical protein
MERNWLFYLDEVVHAGPLFPGLLVSGLPNIPHMFGLESGFRTRLDLVLWDREFGNYICKLPRLRQPSLNVEEIQLLLKDWTLSGELVVR